MQNNLHKQQCIIGFNTCWYNALLKSSYILYVYAVLYKTAILSPHECGLCIHHANPCFVLGYKIWRFILHIFLQPSCKSFSLDLTSGGINGITLTCEFTYIHSPAPLGKISSYTSDLFIEKPFFAVNSHSTSWFIFYNVQYLCNQIIFSSWLNVIQQSVIKFTTFCTLSTVELIISVKWLLGLSSCINVQRVAI